MREVMVVGRRAAAAAAAAAEKRVPFETATSMTFPLAGSRSFCHEVVPRSRDPHRCRWRVLARDYGASVLGGADVSAFGTRDPFGSGSGSEEEDFLQAPLVPGERERSNLGNNFFAGARPGT